MERETGFEPATSTLARLHSTTELLPHFQPRLQPLLLRSLEDQLNERADTTDQSGLCQSTKNLFLTVKTPVRLCILEVCFHCIPVPGIASGAVGEGISRDVLCPSTLVRLE